VKPAKPATEGKGEAVPPGEKEPAKDGDGKTAKDYYSFGFARHKAGDREGAAVAYTRAIEMDPSYAAAYYNRACIYLVKKNYDGLISDTTMALSLGHGSRANLLCLRGTGWAGKGDFDKALTDHNAAIAIDPSYALAYNNRGNDYYRKGDVARAIKDCDKSIELDPSSPLPWYNRGYAHFSLRKYSKAAADWRQAIELQPEYATELEPLLRKVEDR
jgi:tetratricopeptide (TPR) repeat protein